MCCWEIVNVRRQIIVLTVMSIYDFTSLIGMCNGVRILCPALSPGNYALNIKCHPFYVMKANK